MSASVSAEVRWFWRHAAPQALDAWFRDGSSPGGGTPRTDEYLVDPGQRQLGVKTRGGLPGAEVKGLVEQRGSLPAPFGGRIQIWCKWRSEALSIGSLPRVSLHKTRWLRKFDTAGSDVTEVALDADEQPRNDLGYQIERGCQLELVILRVGDRQDLFSSLGFEAFGELPTLEDSLRRTVLHVAATVPPFVAGAELSYPEWLTTLRL